MRIALIRSFRQSQHFSHRLGKVKRDAPVQTAGGLLIDSNGRVLLGLRAHHKRVAPGLWDIVGGRVEHGEAADDALIREIVEELGVRPTRFRLLASLVEQSDGAPLCVHHVYSITEWEGGNPRNACDEHSEVRWFTMGEVRRLDNKTPFDFDDLYSRAREAMPCKAPPAHHVHRRVTDMH